MMKRKTRHLVCILLLVSACSSATSPKHQMVQQKQLKRAEALIGLGEAYMMENKLGLAYQSLSEAKSLNPDAPAIYYNLGNFYNRKGILDKAIASYKQAISIKPQYPAAQNNLGMIYLKKKEWDKAIQCLKPVLTNYAYMVPHRPLFGLGEAYYFKKDYKTAEDYYKQALEVSPDFVLAHYGLGRLYHTTGNHQKALIFLKNVARSQKEFSTLYFYLGKTYLKLKHTEKSISAFKKVVALSPNSEEGRIAKSRLKDLGQ